MLINRDREREILELGWRSRAKVLDIDRLSNSLLPGPKEEARREEADEGHPSDEIKRTPSGSSAAVHTSLPDADDLQATAAQQIVYASFVALL